MTDHECCFWMLALPLDREEQCTVCVSAPLTPFQFQRFPSKITSLSSLRLPTPPPRPPSKKISRHSRRVERVGAYGLDARAAFLPRPACETPASCCTCACCPLWYRRGWKRWAHCRRLQWVGGLRKSGNKGMVLERERNALRKQKSTLRWSRGVKARKYHDSIDSKKKKALRAKITKFPTAPGSRLLCLWENMSQQVPFVMSQGVPPIPLPGCWLCLLGQNVSFYTKTSVWGEKQRCENWQDYGVLLKMSQ